MHVVATAGHVDHGKSTLVRALTGSDPDRLAEEHRRGLSIELGYCWTTMPDVGVVAFVDVPGHERFVPTMLSGAGPAPAVLFVVAADDEWMPQAAEHLAALEAFGVRHGVVAVTRSDLADPTPAKERVAARLGGTGLAGAAVVAVSSKTRAGLTELREALGAMLAQLPRPDPAADVRLWVDRCFAVPGAGTVVTGTLQAGSVRAGDTLLCDSESEVRVRGLQALGHEVPQVAGVARVALRLGRGVPDGLSRGSALVTPGAWRNADVVDVRVTGGETPPERPVLHIGATFVGCHHRPLGETHARLVLDRPLPLRVADRVLLRDPGSARIWGGVVMDPAPPPLARRGAARARATRLEAIATMPDLRDELDRRELVRADLLRRIGVPTEGASSYAVVADGWLLGRNRVDDLSRRLTTLMAEHTAHEPLSPGMPVPAAARALGLPTPALVVPLLPTGLRVRNGRIVTETATRLPADVEQAVAQLEKDLQEHPFQAPDAARLAEIGLHPRAVAAAAAAGRLLRLSDAVVLLPGAEEQAVRLLSRVAQPFTVSQARVQLGTTRRVVLPLLDLLDRRGLTTRLPDDRRQVVQRRD
jgi:selenocysteine-specific elongation factor